MARKSWEGGVMGCRTELRGEKAEFLGSGKHTSLGLAARMIRPRAVSLEARSWEVV